MTNRLAHETSPYLLQHKDNPVDWWPWCDEALDDALQRDVPILLSIGYAACHWCHVMEHESFEDPATAELMNRHFVPVKVDREERPDLDSVYMEAVQTMTGHGGWPMTVFLTPEGVPFYGGTYFPPEDRHGLPSFKRLLAAVAEAWRERRDEVEGQGKQLLDHMGSLQRLRPADGLDRAALDQATSVLATAFDTAHGGFGGAPKFPQPMTLDLLLRLGAGRGGARDERALDIATKTLDAMAAGGIYDQLAGGFHRYSVDAAWVVPHFEKMLYDNAQLLRTYARSYLVTGSDRHRTVAREVAQWMLNEMRDETGGFISTIDADSEGEEGRFYVWTLDEVRDVCRDDAEAVIEHFGMSEAGNFEGKNIPVFATSRDDDVIERARAALLARRAERVAPGRDDKILSAWNGLAASALAEAGSALGEPAWIEAAAAALRFVLTEMRREGRLLRSYRAGTAKQPAFAEDYGFVLEGALALFEATQEREWLDAAKWAADEAIRLFWDSDQGGFFSTGDDAERLVTRPKDLIDNAIPAANSVFALELQRLALITAEDRYAERARAILRLMSAPAARAPLGFGHLLGALDLATGDALEVAVVGDPARRDTQDLMDVVRTRFHPNLVLVAGSGARADIPLLEGRTEIDGSAAAYVCRNMTCDTPVTRPEELAEKIAG